MSAILDIILIAIIVIFAIAGTKKGFIRSVSGFVSHFLSFVLSLTFYKSFTVYIKKIPFIANMITEGIEMPTFEDGGFMQKIKLILTHFILPDDISDSVSGAAESGIDMGNITVISDEVCNNLIAEMLAAIISFIVLLIALIIIFKLVFLILDKIALFPVIKQANGVLGCIFGLLNGMFWVWIAANIFGNILFPILNAQWPEVFMSEMLNSLVYRLCTNSNPMTYIYLLLQKITG